VHVKVEDIELTQKTYTKKNNRAVIDSNQYIILAIIFTTLCFFILNQICRINEEPVCDKIN